MKNRTEINLSPEELNSIKDTESFRATILTEFKYIRRDLDFLLDVKDEQDAKCSKQKECCKSSWRADMLWFCGLPATAIGVIVGLGAIFKMVTK